MCVGLPKERRVILQQDLGRGNASCKIQVMIPKNPSWRDAHDRQWRGFDCGLPMKQTFMSELQTLSLTTGGEESKFHPINVYLMKYSNQIGALSEVVQGTFCFTCISLQITCQSYAWWIITEHVTWVSKSLIPGKGQLWDASKKSGCRTVRKTPYNKALRIYPAGCYTFGSSVENIHPTGGYRQ